MASMYLDNGNADGVVLGQASSTKLGFYGLATPVVRRSGAAQATSNVGTASSTDVDTNLKRAVIEIMNTMAAYGLWAGA